MIVIITAAIAAIFYALGFIVQSKALRDNHPANLMTMHGLIMPALCCHLIVLWLTVYSGIHTDLRFYNAMSLTLFLICCGIYLARARLMRFNLLLVFAPITVVALLLQASFQYPHPVTSGFDWQIQIHASLAVIAFVILAIAAAQALILSFQQAALKNNQQQRLLGWFPPLDSMEQLLFQLITIGFSLLTLTLLSGILFVDDLLAQSLIHKTVLSAIAWVLFGGLLIGHLKFGWRGTKATRITLIAMSLLLLAYFGSKLVLELILNR